MLHWLHLHVASPLGERTALWQPPQLLGELGTVRQPVPVVEDRRLVQRDPLANGLQIGHGQMAGDNMRPRTQRDDGEVAGV